MKNIYYLLWADAICFVKRNPSRVNDWKWLLQLHIGMLMSLKFAVIINILEREIFKTNFYNINFDFMDIPFLKNILEYLFLYFSPFFLLNYFLIFYKSRYTFIIKNYNKNNGKLFIFYYILSISIPIFIFLFITISKDNM